MGEVGGEGEETWGGGEDVRGEGKEISEGVEGAVGRVWHQSDYVGGAR